MQIAVQNTDTGEERMMGEKQFARVKKHGWKKIPKLSSPTAKAETAPDSAPKTETKTADAPNAAIVAILKGNVTSVVAKIKELAKAKDVDTIKAIGELEAKAKEPRSTIATAVTKFTTES